MYIFRSEESFEDFDGRVAQGGGGGVVTPIHIIMGYIGMSRGIAYGFLEVLDSSIAYHFRRCWLSVPGVILR